MSVRQSIDGGRALGALIAGNTFAVDDDGVRVQLELTPDFPSDLVAMVEVRVRPSVGTCVGCVYEQECAYCHSLSQSRMWAFRMFALLCLRRCRTPAIGTTSLY